MTPDERIEPHHVGGHLHGLRRIFVTHDAHTTLTRAQAPYTHLLRRANLPAHVVVAVVLFDLAAVLELVARELRRLGHLLLAPFAMTREGRDLLRHPRATEEGTDDEN